MRRMIQVCFLIVALCTTAVAADFTVVSPVTDLSKPVVLYLPQVGSTCEVLIPVQYLYQWPAAKLGEPTITQGTSQPSLDSVPSPRPTREGDFDLTSYQQELIHGGRVIRLQFTVPDKMTVIAVFAHSYIYNNAFVRTRNAFHPISVEIYPLAPWTEFLEELRVKQE